ncbi:MAG: formate dehydrogenase subunit gamma, partial [Kiloniellaceae bacterium]
MLFGVLSLLGMLVAVGGGLGGLGVAPAFAHIQGGSADQHSSEADNVPGGHLGTRSDSELWRAVRRGTQGKVSIPDKLAGVMIQSEGDNWRAWRNGPITVAGAWATLGTIGALALFFVARGRIMIDAGPSGRTVERFNGVERFSHWLTAVSFIALALTGLNLLYGKHVLMPILGPEVFAAIVLGGKYVHNYVAFAFMVGIVVLFVIWVRDNIPTMDDLRWLAKAGGLLTKGVHPPSRKFNAGQKLIFWLVILGGASLTVSGIALLFPFRLPIFASTFEVLNVFGFGLPTDFGPIQDMQLSQIWHSIVGLAMIAAIMGHIYIGSVGMEGAFGAMGAGHVDANWAQEHHNLWYETLADDDGAGGGESG